MKSPILLFLAAIFFISCQQQSTDYGNPPAEGFNLEQSDSIAIAIADSVMEAMGGRKAWDETRIITWNFFGRRTHTWDKQNGRNHIDIPAQNLVMDFDIETKEGTVIKDGEAMTDADSLDKYLQSGYEMWVNDSYWLVMPFKLKDSGVTLTYLGEDTLQTGEPAYKLQLIFDGVGVTPQNKYEVFVDTTDYLVKQWSYFPEADMIEPRFTLPWIDYKPYGNILLSGNRGQYTLSDIAVLDTWPH